MLRKLPIVAVFGQGTPARPERVALARAAGAMIARLGAHLLTGGGYGVMAAAAEGFVAVERRAGLSIGIIPRAPGGAFDQPNRANDGRAYPNPFVEIAIRTPLQPRTEDWRTTPARNHINVMTPDAIVALPGGPGTDNELDMAAFYRGAAREPQQDRRVILLGPVAEFAAGHRALFVHAETVNEAEHMLARMLAARDLAPAES